jgi:DNA-binding response OmpR family regulator
VVSLDLKLPRVDGLEVLRRMRADEKTKLLPVLVLTSCNEEKDIVASHDLSANRFFRKAVRFSGSAEAIRQLGLYWLMFNQPAPNGVRK